MLGMRTVELSEQQFGLLEQLRRSLKVSRQDALEFALERTARAVKDEALLRSPNAAAEAFGEAELMAIATQAVKSDRAAQRQ
jgi:hypothetical protein